jgi:hypothetical protein
MLNQPPLLVRLIAALKADSVPYTEEGETGRTRNCIILGHGAADCARPYRTEIPSWYRDPNTVSTTKFEGFSERFVGQGRVVRGEISSPSISLSDDACSPDPPVQKQASKVSDKGEPTMHRKLGLPVSAILLLAAIAAIRVPLHDLGIVPEGSVVAGVLVFVPLVIWLIVVLRRRVPNPFLALTAVGLAYGVMLAVIHQLLWTAAYDGSPPSLGGNLEGALAPGLEAVIFRISAFFSSIVTGIVLGAIVGLVAWAIERLRRPDALHP